MNTALLPEKNFTVGPSKLFSGVAENYIENIQKGYASLSHRSSKFSEISQQGIEHFRKYFSIPDEYKIFYTYSATQGLELSIRSLVEKKSIHYINGTFGWVWANIARKNGKETAIQEEIFGTRTPLSPVPKTHSDADIICLTANETSSGIGYSSEEISEFSKIIPENSLLAVDVTSTMGGVSYDFSDADIWAFSVQKAMGLPAGLGILIVSPRAYNKAIKNIENNAEAGNHHSFLALENKMKEKFQTPTTPNVLGIFSFAFICKKFRDVFSNIATSEEKTKEKAKFLYDFFDAHSDFKPFITDKKSRSQTIIVIEGTLEKIREKKKFLEENNILVGGGYGLNKETQIRIANFPVHSLDDMKDLVKFF